MMTIHELIKIIDKEEIKRDFRHEKTPANSTLLKLKCAGTFEAVVTGNGQELCLIPQVGTLHFLFRGQNKEYIPCVPSLYRGNPSDVEIFIERMRYVMFRRLLSTHPVIKYFFRKHHFQVDEEGLAQHYGLKNSVLDLTSNLDIALFFATCWYDSDNDCYHYYDDCKIHDAVLYVFVPILDNEPSISINEGNYLNHNIRPIGLQAFPRPGIQEGYGLHISKNESTKSFMYRFTFTCEDSKVYYDKIMRDKNVWCHDILVNKAKFIAETKEFSFNVFNETFREFRPSGYSSTRLKKLLKHFVTLKTKRNDIVFSSTEQKNIVEEWNNHLGGEMASKIFRKGWFEHDGIDESGSGGKIRGMSNRQEFRTLVKISNEQILNYVACPDSLEKSEWKNYTGKPRPTERPPKDFGKWKEIPASMEEMFGKPYLTKKDWYINL